MGADLLFEYGVNRGTLTSETLDLDEFTGFYRKSISPNSTSFGTGLSHRFKFSDTDVNQYFKILSITFRGRLESSP